MLRNCAMGSPGRTLNQHSIPHLPLHPLMSEEPPSAGISGRTGKLPPSLAIRFRAKPGGPP